MPILLLDNVYYTRDLDTSKQLFHVGLKSQDGFPQMTELSMQVTSYGVLWGSTPLEGTGGEKDGWGRERSWFARQSRQRSQLIF